MSHAAAVVLALVGPLAATAPQAPGGRDLGPADVARVLELHHLQGTLGDRLWPGFDTRRIPIAVNNHDRQEMLVGHPAPPAAFLPFGEPVAGRPPVMIRDGSTHYGPKGGGWSKEIGGEDAAYVGVLDAGRNTEDYLLLILHECFHVYQKRYRPRGAGRQDELPDDDPEYSALLGLESRILRALLDENDDAAPWRELASMFVAVRHERRSGLSAAQVRAEGEQEFSEGTATYVEARACQLLAECGGIAPASETRDPRYRGFAGADAAAKFRSKYLASIEPARGLPIDSMHGRYRIGMAQCLLLDRLCPDWKDDMRAAGATQFALIERALPLTPEAEAELCAVAMYRFGYPELLAEQTRLIEARVAKVRAYLEAEGRRYRIHHGDLRGAFRWQPNGPVYRVPESLLGKGDQPTTVWAGGIARFERADLLFESKAVPILFRHDYLEWIDGDPAADGSDVRIESESEEGGVYRGLVLRTDGFVLRVGRARIERDGDVFAVRPLPAR